MAFVQEFYQARHPSVPPLARSPLAARRRSRLPLTPILPPSRCAQTVRDKCFKACVTKPSTSLSSSEQQCLARCADRYAEATGIVTKAALEASGLE